MGPRNKLPCRRATGYSLRYATGKVCLIPPFRFATLRAGIHPRPRGAGYSTRLNKKSAAGFTLVELLVVISVIGTLASIVLVNMGGARQSAAIAKSKTFSSSIQQKIGIDLVGAWDFEEDSGTVAQDSWETNSGTLVNGPARRSGTECMVDGCLEFDDAASQYVEIPNSSSLQFSDHFTVEAWAKSDDDMAYSLISKGTYFGIYQGWHISTAGSPANLLFEICDGISRSYINFYTGRKFGWTHIVAIRDGNRIMAYADGALKSSMTHSIGSVVNGTNVFLGRRASSAGSYFDGKIDQVRFYSEPLLLSQIKRNYLYGLKRLLAGGQITKAEYDQRIGRLNKEYAAAEY